MEQPAAQAAASWTAAVIKGLLGHRPVFTGWLTLGGVAALCVIAGQFADQSGLDTFAIVLDFFHLPNGAGEFVRGMSSWADVAFSTQVGSLILSVAIALCWFSMASSWEDRRIPSSPSHATFWIALLFFQSAAFAGFGVAVTLCVIAVGYVCLKFRSVGPALEPLIDLFVVLLYPALLLAPLFFNAELRQPTAK